MTTMIIWTATDPLTKRPRVARAVIAGPISPALLMLPGFEAHDADDDPSVLTQGCYSCDAAMPEGHIWDDCDACHDERCQEHREAEETADRLDTLPNGAIYDG